jgi:hypothetical protein
MRQLYLIRFTFNDGTSSFQDDVSSEDIKNILDLWTVKHKGELINLLVTPHQ